jgi:integrase
MASIARRRRTDGTEAWRVGYRQGGRLCWTPTIGTAEGAVEMKGLIERLGPDAALAILRQRSGRDVETSAPLLRDWLERHLRLLEADATPGTIHEYRGMAARTWLPRLGPLPLDAITREVVTEWVAWQRKQVTRRGTRYSPKSIRNAHGLLSAALASAVDEGLIPKNPARGVGLPSDDAEHEMEVLTPAEWEALLDAMDPHYRPLTWFLLVVGCRIGEATAVQVRDLDHVRSTVRIRRAWKKGANDSRYLGSTKTRRGVRTVVLPRALADELAALVRGKPAGALVFTGPRGARVQAQHFRNRQWAKALERAGITKHITPHGLRHTSASWLLAEGVSPIVVQHRLGHESLSTTSKVYAHLLTDAQAGAVDVMERAAPARQLEVSPAVAD